MKTPDRSLAVIAGATALALYVLTLSPDVFWGDAAQLQYLAAEPVFGAAPRSYPLYVAGSHILVRFTPLSPAVAASLFAALCGAIAVALAWIVTRRESGSRFGATVAAVTLAVSHLHWSSSASAEVYGLSAVFLLLLLLLVRPAADGRRGAVFGAGAIIGLSLLHHRVLPVAAAAAALPVLVTWLRTGCALRGVGLAALGFAAGILPFVLLLSTSPEGPWATLLDGTGFQLPGSAPDLPGVSAIAAYIVIFALFNFAGPQVLLALAGLASVVRRPSCTVLALLALLLTGLVLPFGYPQLGDRYIFLLPAYVAAAVFVGVGADRIAVRWRPIGRILLLASVAIFPIATYALAASKVQPGQFGRFSGADPRHLTQILWPGRAGRTEPREFAQRLYEQLPTGALLMHHWGEGQVLLYLRRIESLRPDLELVEVWKEGDLEAVARARAAGRPVFLTTYPFLPFPAESRKRFPCRPVVPGLLWQLDQP